MNIVGVDSVKLSIESIEQGRKNDESPPWSVLHMSQPTLNMNYPVLHMSRTTLNMDYPVLHMSWTTLNMNYPVLHMSQPTLNMG